MQQVSVSSDSPWDMRTLASEGGCPPSGCFPGNTRDGSTDPLSRWSCERVSGRSCEICFSLEGEPQDIVRLEIAFYKGDIRQRLFDVTTLDTSGKTCTYPRFLSTGTTLGFESWDLNSDETVKVCLQYAPNPALSTNTWFSITEVTHRSVHNT